MGLPQILIKFKTAGSTAIRRSARGQVVLLVPGGSRSTVTFSRMDQVEESAVGSTAYELLRLCFLGNPAKVHLAYYLVGAEGAALAGNAKLAEGGWLCAPAMAVDTLVNFVKEKRAEGRSLRAVVCTKTAPDNAGIVNFTTEDITIRLDGKNQPVSTNQYCARVAGILAGLSLRESATYYSLPEVTDFTASADPAGDIEKGCLILDQGSDGVRLGRAVTSLVTLEQAGDSAFRKIKITEGVDLIRADIRSVFESEYVGKVLNDYDSKLLLVTAINSYFASLAGSVLDTGRRNQASVDFDAQKAWLEAQGVDTESMSDTAILSANTGSQVFLRADVRFADAMEDLTFEITMQ
jgi:hypothetical protein